MEGLLHAVDQGFKVFLFHFFLGYESLSALIYGVSATLGQDKTVRQVQIRGSIVVSISACHADDPGSIPGRGVFRATSDLASVQAVSLSGCLWRLWEWATS